MHSQRSPHWQPSAHRAPRTSHDAPCSGGAPVHGCASPPSGPVNVDGPGQTAAAASDAPSSLASAPIVASFDGGGPLAGSPSLPHASAPMTRPAASSDPGPNIDFAVFMAIDSTTRTAEIARQKTKPAPTPRERTPGAGVRLTVGAVLKTRSNTSAVQSALSGERSTGAATDQGAEARPWRKNAMTNESRTSDSISARPRIIGVWMRGAAPGLREIPSSAAAAARP